MNTIPPQGTGAVSPISVGMAPIPCRKSYCIDEYSPGLDCPDIQASDVTNFIAKHLKFINSVEEDLEHRTIFFCNFKLNVY